MNASHIGYCVSLVLLLAGCETLPQRDPDFSPVQAADLKPPAQMNGAIFQTGYEMRLFEDHRATRIGDIITVTLIENTQAQKLSDLQANKDTSISVTAPNMMGIDPSAVFGSNLSAELASAHEFQGQGIANQRNQIIGNISVTVVDVYPNGNLKVRGEKRVTLNDGDEFIRLSGIVRPVDIDSTNTVLSSKIADATIMYTGDGPLANASKMGWFARFFLSPFFPF
jgi:flagellar L-ring protein precursor FlgH